MYKLNNTARIEYKNGTVEEVPYSYVSYTGRGGLGFDNEEIISFHGKQGTPYFMLNMKKISSIRLTDNPSEREEVVNQLLKEKKGDK